MLWRTPAYDSAEWPALDLLRVVLGGGASSRLNRAVVREARSAASIEVLLGLGAPRRGPNLFGILAFASPGRSADSVEVLLQREVSRVATEGVTEEELNLDRHQAVTVNDIRRAAEAVLRTDNSAVTHIVPATRTP